MDHLPIDHLIEFIAQAPPSIAVLDLELRYLAASNGWINSLHLPKDIVGRRHYDLFPELSDEWKSIHQRCMAGETLTSSGDLLRRTGEPDMWVRWEVRPWRRSGGDVGGIIIYSDREPPKIQGPGRAHTGDRPVPQYRSCLRIREHRVL